MAGGNLPFGFAPSGSLTSYTPTLRERATDWVRKKLFTDDRAGQQRAGRVMDVANLTPFGFGLDVYDAGREAGMGNYGTAGVMLGMAGMPGPSPKGIRAYHGTRYEFDDFENEMNWFSDSPDYAAWIARGDPRRGVPYREGANVRPVDLEFKNPKTISLVDEAKKVADQIGEKAPETPLEAQEFLAGMQGWDVSVRNMWNEALNDGFDGLILSDFDDAFPGGKTTAYIAGPERVKSRFGR